MVVFKILKFNRFDCSIFIVDLYCMTNFIVSWYVIFGLMINNNERVDILFLVSRRVLMLRFKN